MAGIEGALITSADIVPLFPVPGAAPITGLPAAVLEKIKYIKEALHQPYNIPQGRPVYITSDVHSDLEKLMFLFHNAGLIDLFYTTNPADAALPNYVSNPFQILEFITNFKIVYPLPFIVILVGDIVDGARYDNGPQYSINDPIGNLEILLHIFLFNFRIKASILGSELRFTIGNHDWCTVVNKTPNPYMYIQYVTDSSKRYFNPNFNLAETDKYKGPPTLYPQPVQDDIIHSWQNRRACLLPFYEACPFLVTTIDTEIICVHGGLFRLGGAGEAAQVNMTNELILIQQKIDQANSLAVISDAEIKFLSEPNSKQSPLWTRYYQHVARDAACTRTGFKMTVVGHCPTDMPRGGYHLELMYEQRYAGCAGGGCVLVGCERDDGPGLALVDITMSRAFNPDHVNYSRRGELLYLSNYPAGPPTRFYNNIYRINVGISSPPDVIRIYPPSAESPDPGLPALPQGPDPPALPPPLPPQTPMPGGRRRKRTRRKRKMSRKNRR